MFCLHEYFFPENVDLVAISSNTFSISLSVQTKYFTVKIYF